MPPRANVGPSSLRADDASCGGDLVFFLPHGPAAQHDRPGEYPDVHPLSWRAPSDQFFDLGNGGVAFVAQDRALQKRVVVDRRGAS